MMHKPLYKNAQTASVKLCIRDERTDERTNRETRVFVRCVCQGRPSYEGEGGRTAMLRRNL